MGSMSIPSPLPDGSRKGAAVRNCTAPAGERRKRQSKREKGLEGNEQGTKIAISAMEGRTLRVVRRQSGQKFPAPGKIGDSGKSIEEGKKVGADHAKGEVGSGGRQGNRMGAEPPISPSGKAKEGYGTN